MRELKKKILRLNKCIGKIVPANYYLTKKCNLNCIGCLFFEGEDFQGIEEELDLAQWEAQFKRDADAGINYVYLVGGEPSLCPEKLLLAAKYFKYGHIPTNGIVKIPDEIPFNIHISVWGIGEKGAALRGKDVFAQAVENYKHDARAVCSFLISAQNIEQIIPAAGIAYNNGLKMTFSYFSPTMSYVQENLRSDGVDEGGLMLGQDEFREAARNIEIARERYGDSILYSKHHNEWVSRENIYDIDPVTGIAQDCAIRSTQKNSLNVDLSPLKKCCNPSFDCRFCRANVMTYITYFMKINEFRKDKEQLQGWLETREVWSRFSLPQKEIENWDYEWISR